MIIRKAAESDISAISELAEKIWWPSYRNIISDEQISFMLNDMYSAESLKVQMNSGIEFLIVERENIPLASRANGRAPMAISAAFFIFTVEISSIARVIFPVLRTDLIRSRICFQAGIGY